MKHATKKCLAVLMALALLCVMPMLASAEDVPLEAADSTTETETESVDKTELIWLIAYSKEIERLWIPTFAWNRLQKAIINAQAVVDDEFATAEQVSEQRYELVNAKDAAEIVRELVYSPGTILMLFQYQLWNSGTFLIFLPQLLLSPIWMPIHLVLVGFSWFIGLFQ